MVHGGNHASKSVMQTVLREMVNVINNCDIPGRECINATSIDVVRAIIM